MRVGTQVAILIPNKFKSKNTDPDFIRVPGLVVSEPIPTSYTNRNTGATIASATVEVITRRDTTGQNPNGGRVWWQATQEPSNLLVRRFGDPVVGLDVAEDGSRMTAQALWAKVEESIEDLRRRQLAAKSGAEPAVATA